MRTPAMRWLSIIVGAHLLLGLAYDWATPILEASDEGAHYAVVWWLAQGNRLPVQDPSAPEPMWAQEGSQPPLYYLLAAGLTAWVDTSDIEQVFVRNPLSRVGIPGTTHNANLYRHPLEPRPWTGTALAVHLVRWFSLLLSGLTIGLAYLLAYRVTAGDETASLLACALAAFNPMVLFINAAVNNDNLLMLLSTAVLGLTVYLMQSAEKQTAAPCLGLGALLGLAALTKVSGLVLWPVAALGLAWPVLQTVVRGRQPRPLVPLALRLGLVFAAALAVSGWWFWRNVDLYGELLGLETMVAVAGPREPALSLLELIRAEWYGFYLSYWSVFGVFTVLPSAWVPLVFHGLTLWALAGGLWGAARRRIRLRAEHGLLAVFCLLTLVGVINWTMQTKASQGRLMFGAVAPLSIFMALGLLAPLRAAGSERAARLGALVLGLGALPVVAGIVPVVDIAPRYAPPRQLAEADLPAGLQRVHAVFGESIELIGYTWDDAPREPGGVQPVTLYWRSLAPMQADYVAALHLLGRDRSEVGKIDTWPGGGAAPTSFWPAGAIFADHYLLPIDPRAAAPTRLRLDVTFWEGDPANQLSIRDARGSAIPSVSLEAGRLISASGERANPDVLLASRFEHGIELVGLDAAEGGTVTLYWRADQPVPGDFVVFAHLLDAQGEPVAQADSEPLGGDWPTSAWIPGQTVVDPHHFDLPAALPPGRYSLHLGLYQAGSGERLPAFTAGGPPWRDNIVVVPDVIEIK